MFYYFSFFFIIIIPVRVHTCRYKNKKIIIITLYPYVIAPIAVQNFSCTQRTCGHRAEDSLSRSPVHREQTRQVLILPVQASPLLLDTRDAKPLRQNSFTPCLPPTVLFFNELRAFPSTPWNRTTVHS